MFPSVGLEINSPPDTRFVADPDVAGAFLDFSGNGIMIKSLVTEWMSNLEWVCVFGAEGLESVCGCRRAKILPQAAWSRSRMALMLIEDISVGDLRCLSF